MESMKFPPERSDAVIRFLIEQSTQLELWRQGVLPEHPRVENNSTENAVPLAVRRQKLI